MQHSEDILPPYGFQYGRDEKVYLTEPNEDKIYHKAKEIIDLGE